MGPPSCASGPTWPMQKPRVAPEKRPSVISATLSPIPCPRVPPWSTAFRASPARNAQDHGFGEPPKPFVQARSVDS